MHKYERKENNENGKSVNHQQLLKYQKKIPKNSKVFIKNRSQEKNKNENFQNDFKSIMKQMYSEMVQNKLLKGEKEDNEEIEINPKKKLFFNSFHRKAKNNGRKKSYQSQNHDLIFEKLKDKLSIKRVKLKKENEEIFSPICDYNNKLMDRFTQISIIKPNKNDLFMEQNSDSDIQNEEYVYFYEPNKEIRLELGNSSKREIKNIFVNNFPENKLILSKEISFSFDNIIDEEKKRNDSKYKDLIKKGEEYDILLNKYNALLNELNELKNKTTNINENGKNKEKIIQHLEDLIIPCVNNNITKTNNKKKKYKVKKFQKKRIQSLTPKKINYSSSEETKTRDNSKNNYGVDLTKIKKYIPNIMIVSKENEFNLAASYTKMLNNDSNTLTIKPKKKIKKVKKNNAENNWNSSITITPNITFKFLGNKNNITVNDVQKNKPKLKTRRKLKKKVLNNKETSTERNKTSLNNSCRKIKRINLPVIHIKNETLSYNIRTKYIRFKNETKSVDFKNNNKSNRYKIFLNQLKNNYDHRHNHSESLDTKEKSRIKDDGIIVKNINLNIINKFKNKNQEKDESENINDTKNNEYTESNKKEEDQNYENNSENKDFSYFSNEIKDNNDYLSEDEKHKKVNNNLSRISNYNKKNEFKTEPKEKKYTFRVKIVKYSNKKRSTHKYFDTLFGDLINKILKKRIFKKWLKISKQ